jgi:hypothetical protein
LVVPRSIPTIFDISSTPSLIQTFKRLDFELNDSEHKVGELDQGWSVVNIVLEQQAVSVCAERWEKESEAPHDWGASLISVGLMTGLGRYLIIPTLRIHSTRACKYSSETCSAFAIADQSGKPSLADLMASIMSFSSLVGFIKHSNSTL